MHFSPGLGLQRAAAEDQPWSGRHTKVVSSALVQQSYNLSAVLFLQDCIRKANGSTFAPQGYSLFADPQQTGSSGISVFQSPGFQSTLFLCFDSANISLTISLDEFFSEVSGHEPYAICISWFETIRRSGGLWSDPFTSTEFFGHEADNKPVTQCGNTDPIHGYNQPQDILPTVQISHM